MTRDELIALAREAAAARQLDPELVCAVCEQESGWNPWAIRYEPAFFERYIVPLADAGKIVPGGETEARARAFSYGLMQVMGQVARERGFPGRFLSELCHPATGLAVGCDVLARKLAAAEGNVARALRLWNGGANPNYPSEVLTRAAKYKV